MADKPQLTERAQAELAARHAREAAALRANLRRRKAQRSPPVSNPLPDEPAVAHEPCPAGSKPG